MESLKNSVDEHKTVNIPHNSLQSHDKFLERLKTFDVNFNRKSILFFFYLNFNPSFSYVNGLQNQKPTRQLNVLNMAGLIIVKIHLNAYHVQIYFMFIRQSIKS